MSEVFTREDIQQLERAVGEKVKFYEGLFSEALKNDDTENIGIWGQSVAIAKVCHLAFLCKLDEIYRAKVDREAYKEASE